MICAGIDAGSRTLKIVFWDTDRRKIRACGLIDQGVRQNALAERLFRRLLRETRISARQVTRVVATGYARDIIFLADTTVTEITCQAVGVRHQMPKVMTIIDIGGQDSKIIHLNEDGTVRDFAMNDRCAAGTGHFIEMTAGKLRLNLKSLDRIACKSRHPVPINSMCAVFAETEIIGLLAAGSARENILAGVRQAVARRIASLAGSHLISPIAFTGGVALIPGMREALKSALGTPVLVTRDCQYTAAIGAAKIAENPDEN